MENTELREKLDILGKTAKGEDNQEPKKQGMKLNVISGTIFGMTRERTKIMSIISGGEELERTVPITAAVRLDN